MHAVQPAYEAARARWPEVRLALDAFEDHVRECSGSHLADLYLAAAASRGDAAAIRAIETEYFGEVERAIRGARNLSLQPDELAQLLRAKLFVAGPGERPKIAEYSGQGPLRMWIRVSLLRLIQNIAIRGPRETPLDGEAFAEIPAPTADPELEHLRQLYGAEFRAAFKDSFSALPVRDQELLRQRFMARRTQEELAAAYDVHVNTISRWLTSARTSLEDGVRAALRSRLKIAEGQFTSILRLVRSQLDVSLGG